MVAFLQRPTLGTIFFAVTVSAVAAFAQGGADSPFQVRYASNLNIGDSVVNISNTGANGAALPFGTTAVITGALCVNAYAFTPDEQMLSCCSCPVTPNGLVSMSVKNDLVNNTLAPAIPTSVVIKLLATVPVAGSCVNSAAAVTAATPKNGMVAWGTTIHAGPTPGMYFGVETAFTPATLSTGELTRLGSLCSSIIANGNGFGVCRSCRLGGLGATKN